MFILGVSCFYHDSAAALLQDGVVIAAAEEERFSRLKHDSSYPKLAIQFCLDEAGIKAGDLDYVVFYEKPFVKFERLLETYLAFAPRGLSLQVVQPAQQESARPIGRATYNDDIFQGWFGIGSQLDGLGHLGYEGMYYNCNHAHDFAGISGLTKLGIEKVPPLVARGVVLDMAGHFGKSHMENVIYW